MELFKSPATLSTLPETPRGHWVWVSPFIPIRLNGFVSLYWNREQQPASIRPTFADVRCWEIDGRCYIENGDELNLRSKRSNCSLPGGRQPQPLRGSS